MKLKIANFVPNGMNNVSSEIKYVAVCHDE